MCSAPATRAPAGEVRVYLIRHGETRWSLTGQHTGRIDLPLTAHGEDQASSAGRLLRGIAFSHVFTSPMRRAQRTCTLAKLSRPAMIDPDLGEWDYGTYEGQKTIDIRKDRPGWNVFRDGCPNGETPDQVGARADRLIHRLRTLDGNIACYSHGQFGSVLAARWIGLPVAHGQHFQLDVASLGILGYEPAHLEVPVIALWNETTSPSPACPADHAQAPDDDTTKENT